MAGILAHRRCCQTAAMPELVLPDVRVRESFLEAMREVIAEGNRAEAATMGSEQTRFGAAWKSPDGFADYVATVRADGAETTPRRIGIVPHTTWWWVDEDDYLGRISLRHRLTEFLLEVGGHVGYYVRPSRRRRGHATAMLRAVLPHAAALGLERVLVTCDETNVGSRRVIEAAGGVLEDQRGVKLRYWVPTADPHR
jgi:predicted acetyltransferase